MDERLIPGVHRRLLFICKSDLRGGAAIVTFRLVEALRRLGHDARMLVCEKLSDADFVQLCAPEYIIKAIFYKERLKVYLDNGRNRETLFKIDPAFDGLPIWNHPWAKHADAFFLSWINQGMLSMKGVRRICGFGKPVVWIMHDMWNMTGVCHHAGECTGYLHQCGDCPLLGNKANHDDLSHRVWLNKDYSYKSTNITFVAVSTWLASKAKESELMRNIDVKVIPNAFDIGFEQTHKVLEIIDLSDRQNIPTSSDKTPEPQSPVKIIFGGARLDDPVKNLPLLKKALAIIRNNHRDIADNLELVTFGQFKLPESADGFDIKHTHLGMLKGNDAVRQAYKGCGIVVSTSDYETLPGTLIEGQAYGCIPVATNHGGQRDIIDHLVNGWLATWNDSPAIRAEEIAKGIVWAYNICRSPHAEQFRATMKESVLTKFSATRVANKILSLLDQ